MFLERFAAPTVESDRLLDAFSAKLLAPAEELALIAVALGWKLNKLVDGLPFAAAAATAEEEEAVYAFSFARSA